MIPRRSIVGLYRVNFWPIQVKQSIWGGLLSQSNTNNEEKVPLLGDIPLLGNLFKYQTKKIEKTELVLLITPYVITSKEEAEFYTDQFRILSGWDPMPKRSQSDAGLDR
ncbi:hypothetical protein [Aeromonas salmonicida]